MAEKKGRAMVNRRELVNAGNIGLWVAIAPRHELETASCERLNLPAMAQKYLSRLSNKNTQKNYASQLQYILIELESLDKQAVSQWLLRQRSSNVSRSTKRLRWSALCWLARELRADDHTDIFSPSDFPPSRLKELASLGNVSQSHKRSSFTVEQVNQLLGVCDTATVKGLRDYCLIKLLALTGLRIDAAVNATAGQLSIHNGQVYLEYQSKGHSSADELKDLRPDLIQDLEKLHGQALTDMPDDTPLIPAYRQDINGQALTTNGAWRIITSIIGRAGLAGLGLCPHSLRHFYASQLIKAVGIEQTRAALAHSDSKTTLIYTADAYRLANNGQYIPIAGSYKNGN